MARPAVSGRDGPPIAPDGATFTRLEPDLQYRLETKGTRKAVVAPTAGTDVGGAFSKVTLLDESNAAVGFTGGGQVGKPCGMCDATAFGR